MNIDKLIKVIQEANPEKEWELQHIHGVMAVPIRLADVLIAITKKEEFLFALIMIDTMGRFHKNGKIVAQWNLKDNSLDNQSKETKQFLKKLLT